ncbi:J domain-containing protein [Pontibacter arcticus]|uniref:J domain-containing protein n=1 Tax=Pontibacter arcticus TaxID=2080288 RepID=A0A364RIA8_9BACT|nr:J domain-containing protein [Pontibacter arcticus]RAU84004.1 J domain-containing protein [Pontibacter arcticus]
MPKATAPARIFLPQISAPDQQELTNLQTAFNRKIQQIDALKQDLIAREVSIALARHRIQNELQPLTDQLIAKRLELLYLLDAAYEQPVFGKREKVKLASLIESLAASLIRNYGKTELLPLHDKYARHPYAESITEQEQPQGKPEPAAPEIDWENLSPEEMQAHLDNETAQRDQEKRNRQANRKTKAQQVKEKQVKEALSNISKASRRVYTDLAKQLHPDTEQNPEARAWKEEAMKQVTNAYHNDDFFELLRLQMEFMQRQNNPLAKLPEEQLGFYLNILDEQIKELQEKLHEFKYGTDPDHFDLYSGTPKQMDQRFKQTKESLLQTLAQLKQELKELHDPQQVKVLLKNMR